MKHRHIKKYINRYFKKLGRSENIELNVIGFNLRGDAVSYLLKYYLLCKRCDNKQSGAHIIKKDLYAEKMIKRHDMHTRVNRMRGYEDNRINSLIEAQKIYNYKLKIVQILPNVEELGCGDYAELVNLIQNMKWKYERKEIDYAEKIKNIMQSTEELKAITGEVEVKDTYLKTHQEIKNISKKMEDK